MNWKNLMKNGFALILTILISFQTVQAIGITRPIPYDLALLRGDSARFSFQIQSTSNEKISCTYSISGLEPLEIKFDKDITVVDAGGVANVYGTVSVPYGTSIGQYSGDLTVRCIPFVEGEEMSGSVVNQGITGPSFTVKVVETEEEKYIREIQEAKQPGISYLAIITIIIVVIVLVSGVYYFSSKKKKIGKLDTSNPSSPSSASV